MNIEKLINILGGQQNIASVTNCMTRLRISVKSETDIHEGEIASLDGVLGLVHDVPCKFEIVVGPGKSRKYADICHDMGLPSASSSEDETETDWKKNKAEVKGRQKDSKLKRFLKTFGDIFVPLIPGTIAAGLCSGFAMLISQLCPNYNEYIVLNLLYQLLTVVNISFMTYIAAWAGYRAAERFGATPILGGMLGIITSLDNVNTIAIAMGLYNESSPLDSILHSGKGGVLAAIVGVFVLSKVEKALRKRMPDSLDIVFTPLLSILICLIPYLFVFMPLLGYISNGICWVFGEICMSEYAPVRAVAGFLGAALFLPLVATGMHHGLVALYTVQLNQLGYVTLYPALAMAGAGQVGASIAILIRCRKIRDQRLVKTITGALPAGFLGVGEPLIYGVTLPLGKPFITAGIGAGFGGALVMMFRVASTTWGPSGVLGAFVMTAGPQGALKSVAIYMLGLLVSYVMGGVITYLAIRPKGQEIVFKKDKDIKSENRNDPEELPVKNGEVKTVSHGDLLMTVGYAKGISYTVKDPNGIHARPASALCGIAAGYRSRITISANGKEVELDGIVTLMSLNIKCGTVIRVKAEGCDAPEALWNIKNYLEESL